MYKIMKGDKMENINAEVLIRELKQLEKKKRNQGLNEYADGVQQSINEVVKMLDKQKGLN